MGGLDEDEKLTNGAMSNGAMMGCAGLKNPTEKTRVDFFHPLRERASKEGRRAASATVALSNTRPSS